MNYCGRVACLRSWAGFTGMQAESRAIVLGTISERPADVARMVGTNFVDGLFTHEPAAEFRAGYQVPSFTSLIAGKFGQRTVWGIS